MTLLEALFATGVVALLVFLTGLYVAAEFATVSARRTRIVQLAENGNQWARMLLPIMEDPHTLDRYIAACQLGITASSLVLGAYGQAVVAVALLPLFNGVAGLDAVATRSLAATVVLIALTLLQMILSELFPKSLAIQYPERVAMAVLVPMRWSLWLMRPAIALFNGSGDLLLKLMGVAQRHEHAHMHSPDEIEMLVGQSHQGGLVGTSEKQMLRNTFRLGDLTARQVMVPRTRLTAAPVESTVNELLQQAIRVKFSRIPVYRGTIDDIVGFVSVKGLFRLHLRGVHDAQEAIHPVSYVPESQPIATVWATLRATRHYLAVVVDEYGGTAGLISFEDILEEIFGELRDEFDRETAKASSDPEGLLHLRGDLLVADVNEYLELRLPEDEADTLGGLVFNTLGRVPQAGDEVTITGVTIRVESLDGMSVAEVTIKLPGGRVAAEVEEWRGQSRVESGADGGMQTGAQDDAPGTGKGEAS